MPGSRFGDTQFYFDWGNYATMLKLIRTERDPKKKAALYAAFLLVVPAFSGVHAVCFALDPLVFPSLRRTEVKAPVFSVGHARSGTTYLHRLMAEDSRFSYFLMWEMFFPSLLEKKILRGLLNLDRRLGGRVRRRLDEATEKALEDTSDMHSTGLFAPEEDDFVLTWSLASGFWMVLFPYLDELDFYHLDRWPAAKRKRVMAFYRQCVRRQLALNGAPTHLSKNPTFCGRVEALIETFPDARFVVPVRNPHETIPSLLKMLQRTWEGLGADEERINASLAVLAEQSYDSYEHPLEVLGAHRETASIVVDYRDLVQEPGATLRGVYEALGLEVTPEMEEVFDAAGRGQGHETTHRYSLEEFGLDPDAIQAGLAPLFSQFNWIDEDSTEVEKVVADD
ncbi:sulfotransferase [Nocardioides sp.]|uniref:sulfotransferase family protein n=1 Tax=Nocardioides sp. TaxID=35761 RepID=UPI00356A1B82